MGKNRVFGGTCTPLLVGFDHPSSCWKMYQQSLFGEPERYLGALPKSGMMQNGQLYQLDNLEHPSLEKDGSVLPTPAASDAWNMRDSRKRFNNPTSKEYNEKKAKNPTCQNLYTAVTMLPTPSANEAKNTPSAGSSQWKRKDSLNIEAARLQGYNQETIGKEARLNPHFVQWMMGFPIGWLD